jgi:putative MATE family efflux protein
MVRFSLPILASSVLQSLNTSINAIWLGRLLGVRALSASTNANSLVFFLLGAVFGLGLAATVLVGQSVGGKDLDQAKRTIGTSVTFFGALSVALAVFGIAFAPQILIAMHTPADSLPLASKYLRVIFVALPGMYLYSFVMMALRGAGDSKTPFVFLLISAVIDVGLNPVLIKGFGPIPALGIAGSAMATMIAQWSTLFALIGWLYHSKHFLRLARGEGHYLRIDPQILRALITKGVPMGLSMVVMSASMLVLISLVNRYGSHTTAAYGACFQLWSYVQMPSFAVGNAVSSMAAQNVGAKLWDRVSRIAIVGVVYSMLLTSVLVIAITIVRRAAFALFLGTDTSAIKTAVHIHGIVSWSFILLGVSFVLSSVMRATGAVVWPLVILFISLWIIRLPFAYTMLGTMGAESIWWSFPLGSASSVLMTAIYYRFGNWRAAHML